MTGELGVLSEIVAKIEAVMKHWEIRAVMINGKWYIAETELSYVACLTIV